MRVRATSVWLVWLAAQSVRSVVIAAAPAHDQSESSFAACLWDEQQCSRSPDPQLAVQGRANLTKSSDDGQLRFAQQLTVTQVSNDTGCPPLRGATQSQLVEWLTAPCRYDRLERPEAVRKGGDASPVEVYARTYVYVMQVLDSSDLQFTMQGLFQLRYVDTRLAFAAVAPNRTQPIRGESQLRDRIWVPHIFLANEYASSVMGTAEEDVLTSIAADGTVIISSRIQATLFCWMDLKMFPFDEQHCSVVLESWMYNASELMLHWESRTPIAFDPKMQLAAYDLEYAWSNETVLNADLNDLSHGAFAGNYSSLSFTVHLTRQVGYYIMDYFLPSMMIVAHSWVSFWLQADQTSARTTLGTATMLAFITLGSSQEKNLPKVNYINISEVWFLACTIFIFSSLVEFAFANTIWCRNRHLHLKKVTSKHILRSTLTPSSSRQNLSALGAESSPSNSRITKYLTVELPKITLRRDSQALALAQAHTHPHVHHNANSGTTTEELDEHVCGDKETEGGHSWSTMSPHEASLWIDRKARFAFPLAFLLFNAIFWTCVYWL